MMDYIAIDPYQSNLYLQALSIRAEAGLSPMENWYERCDNDPERSTWNRSKEYG